MKIKIWLLASCLFVFFSTYVKEFDFRELNQFEQIVIWGHKLHTHTHSYIHNAFYEAFKYLGKKVLWLDASDDIKNISFSNSLFITEGQVDKGMPILRDCFYILHNCDFTKPSYKAIEDQANVLFLQVYTKDCLRSSEDLICLDRCIFFSKRHRTLYMPWATDIFPEQINENIEKVKKGLNKKNNIAWIGTVGGGIFGNINQLTPFINSARRRNIVFNATMLNKSIQDNQKLVQEAVLAPAIQGAWQVDKGYIPCRIFKNISYGALGVTNSEVVFELFDRDIIFSLDTRILFDEAIKEVNNTSKIIRNMEYVRENHTYLNRIATLCQCIQALKE